jgi:hypothetical protein
LWRLYVRTLSVIVVLFALALVDLGSSRGDEGRAPFLADLTLGSTFGVDVAIGLSSNPGGATGSTPLGMRIIARGEWQAMPALKLFVHAPAVVRLFGSGESRDVNSGSGTTVFGARLAGHLGSPFLTGGLGISISTGAGGALLGGLETEASHDPAAWAFADQGAARLALGLRNSWSDKTFAQIEASYMRLFLGVHADDHSGYGLGVASGMHLGGGYWIVGEVSAVSFQDARGLDSGGADIGVQVRSTGDVEATLLISWNHSHLPLLVDSVDALSIGLQLRSPHL